MAYSVDSSYSFSYGRLLFFFQYMNAKTKLVQLVEPITSAQTAKSFCQKKMLRFVFSVENRLNRKACPPPEGSISSFC
jgi:hypothetical protein